MTKEPQPKYMKVCELSAELGRNSASFNRTLKSRGVELTQLTDEKNSPYYITIDDAEKVREAINNPSIQKNQDVDDLPRNPGVYLVEVPSYEKTPRFKIGWSDDVQKRLANYRTILPDLRVLRFWPTTYRHLERTALMIGEKNGRRVYTELFEFSDLEEALENLDRLFSLVGVESCLVSVKD